jgi:hypothetical protein
MAIDWLILGDGDFGGLVELIFILVVVAISIIAGAVQKSMQKAKERQAEEEQRRRLKRQQEREQAPQRPEREARAQERPRSLAEAARQPRSAQQPQRQPSQADLILQRRRQQAEAARQQARRLRQPQPPPVTLPAELGEQTLAEIRRLQGRLQQLEQERERRLHMERRGVGHLAAGEGQAGPAATAARIAMHLNLADPEAARRAIVAMEILGPPKALRREDSPWG